MHHSVFYSQNPLASSYGLIRDLIYAMIVRLIDDLNALEELITTKVDSIERARRARSRTACGKG